MSSNHKPQYLPQISMSVDEMIEKLNDENIDFEFIKADPSKLKSSQPFVLSTSVYSSKMNPKNPIWIDKDNNVIDGHHRWVNALTSGTPVSSIKLNLGFNDSCRVLNKIQDIYEYNKHLELEEMAIKAVDNTQDSDRTDDNFLDSLETDNADIQTNSPSRNKVTVIAYRKDPIKEDSVIGNFFVLKPKKGFSKYEIGFDNLLNAKDLGVTYKDSQVPVEVLAKIWFPHVNFEELAKQHNTTSINLKNKAIAKKAQNMGFDGIKYNDTLIQGLK